MDLSRVDTAATMGTSALHRTMPAAKLVSFALLLVAVMVTSNVLIVAAVGCFLVAVVLALRLPFAPIALLAAYPGIFAAVFAFAAATDMLSAALIVGKAVTAALAAVILMFTTPYPQVFAPLQRAVPAVIADAMLMTYRSLFLLLERFGHTLTAAKLRAGLVGRNPVRSAATVTRALGGVLLYSIDLSQRTHDIMHLRGYDGRLVVTVQPTISRLLDLTTVALAASLCAMAIAWRVLWPLLNPYAWVPLAVSLAALAVALLLGTLRRDHR